MLTDDSPMPFGTYQGTKMKDLPTSYLRWAILNIRNGEVADYVQAKIKQVNSADTKPVKTKPVYAHNSPYAKARDIKSSGSLPVPNLNLLMGSCKGSISLFINEHRDIYTTVEKYMDQAEKDIDESILQKMIELDTIIHICAYPDSPVSFYEVYHYDLNIAICKIMKACGI